MVLSLRVALLRGAGSKHLLVFVAAMDAQHSEKLVVLLQFVQVTLG